MGEEWLCVCGPVVRNAWHQPQLRLRVLIAAAAFCLVASGVYIFNDLFDREQDRNDARKKSRPLAAGRVSAGTAVILLIVLWILSFGLALRPLAPCWNSLLYIVLNVRTQFD